MCNDDPKFRKLRPANPALQAKLFSAPGAQALLAAVGFVAEGDFLVLPGPLQVPEEVIARVASAAEALGAPPRAVVTVAAAGGGGGGGGAAPQSPEDRAAAERQAAAAKARAEREAEKERIRKQLEEDKKERAAEAAKRPITGSTACAKGAGGFSKFENQSGGGG